VNGDAYPPEARFGRQRAHGAASALALRWSGLGLLLVAELAALGFRFDTESLAGKPQWWAKAVDASPVVPAVLIVVALATLVFGGTKLKAAFEEVADAACGSPQSCLCYLVCHFISLAAFTALTWFVFEGGMANTALPGLWFSGWAAAAAATLAFWIAAAVPPVLWLSLLKQTYPQVLLGSAVGIVAWRCGALSGQLWDSMNRWTFELVRRLVSLTLGECYCEPAEYAVGTSSFSVCIDRRCAGYQGIGLIAVFLAFYLWFYRKTLRFPQALLLLPAGIATIWLANALRIAALVVIGSVFSRAVALGGFHSLAGWLLFNAIALGLVAISSRWRFFSARVSPAAKTSNPTVPLLAPFLAGLAVAMLTGLFSSGFDRLYPLRVVAVLGTAWCFRKAYAEFQWSWSWWAVGLGAIVAGLWILLAPKPATLSVSPLGLAGVPIVLATGWWLFRLLGYVIAAPLAEELAFRGYLARRLISADFQDVPPGRFSWWSLAASSAVFGAFHGRAWLAGCLAGMLFLIATYHRGRIADAVLAHATANGLLASYAATTGNWYLWS
jgi:exosortase E/protease (VPEID-CTERM system)